MTSHNIVRQSLFGYPPGTRALGSTYERISTLPAWNEDPAVRILNTRPPLTSCRCKSPMSHAANDLRQTKNLHSAIHLYSSIRQLSIHHVHQLSPLPIPIRRPQGDNSWVPQWRNHKLHSDLEERPRCNPLHPSLSPPNPHARSPQRPHQDPSSRLHLRWPIIPSRRRSRLPHGLPRRLRGRFLLRSPRHRIHRHGRDVRQNP